MSIMTIIEQLFHMAPDSGSGALEVVILISILVIPLTLAALRLKRRNERSSLPPAKG
jgi:hypothetical protein